MYLYTYHTFTFFSKFFSFFDVAAGNSFGVAIDPCITDDIDDDVDGWLSLASKFKTGDADGAPAKQPTKNKTEVLNLHKLIHTHKLFTFKTTNAWIVFGVKCI